MVAAAGLMLGTDGENPTAEEASRLEGVWRFDSVEVDGVKRPDLPFAANKVIILKDGRFVIMQGKQITHGIMNLDISKTPKQYDSTITSGPAKGQSFPVIYDLQGDTFKLCGPYAGGARPTEFATSAGSGLVMQVLKREKQTVAEAVAEAARKELEGGWERTSRTLNGKPMAEDSAQKPLLIFNSDGRVLEFGDQGVREATTHIDGLSEPLAIDFTYTGGDLKSQSSLGIALVDGDTLTICRAAPGASRPKEFASEAGSETTLIRYKRATPGN
jgi:uncharacterized protein (TIGR03067 family)